MRSLIIPVLIMLLFGSGCIQGRPDQTETGRDEAGAKEESVELVRAVTPRLGELAARLEITARVSALERADVLPRLEGLVVEVLVEEGRDVEAGDLLARIEDDQTRIALEKAAVAFEQAELAAEVAELSREEAKARLAAAENTLGQRKSELDRARAQWEKKAIAEQDREKAEYDHTTALSEREQAALRLRQADEEIAKAKLTVKDARIAREKAELDHSWTRIKAPIRGRVTRRHLRLGQKAIMGQPAFTIADLSTLVIEPKVPEKDLRVLRLGLPVRVETTSYPGVRYEGRVTQVAPEIEVDGGSVRVRIALEEGSPPLRPGMFVSGHIETERREQVVLLPKKALLFDRNRPYVFVLDRDGARNRVRKVYLRRGLQDAENVEYLAPEGREPEIDATSRVVVVGLDKLTDGAEVQLEGEAEEASEASSTAADAKAATDAEDL